VAFGGLQKETRHRRRPAPIKPVDRLDASPRLNGSRPSRRVRLRQRLQDSAPPLSNGHGGAGACVLGLLDRGSGSIASPPARPALELPKRRQWWMWFLVGAGCGETMGNGTQIGEPTGRWLLRVGPRLSSKAHGPRTETGPLGLARARGQAPRYPTFVIFVPSVASRCPTVAVDHAFSPVHPGAPQRQTTARPPPRPWCAPGDRTLPQSFTRLPHSGQVSSSGPSLG
jgi:hypothetical protein